MSYPWIKDSQYLTPTPVIGYLAVTSPNGLYLTNGISTTIITPTSVTSPTFNGTATTATNVGITVDNTSGTYYLPFVKTTGTGNKPLFIDDTTGPLSYNPNTGQFIVSTTLKLDGTGGNGRVAIGVSAGATTNGTNTIAIGTNAGQGTTTGQGNNAIAIGNGAGQVSQIAGSICLNASGTALNPSTAGCYIHPIRNATQTNVIGYDTTTKEMSYYITGSSANFNGTPTGGTTTTFFENGIQYRAHVFSASGFFAVNGITSPTTIDLLIVGGGGSGGNGANVSANNSPGGGGGAGQVLVLYEVLLNSSGGGAVSFTVTVGGGGNNSSGTDSSFLIPGTVISYTGAPLLIKAGGGGKGGNAGVAGTSGLDGFNEATIQTFNTSTSTQLATKGSGGGGGGDDGNDRQGGNGGFAAQSFSRTSGNWFGGGFDGGTGGNDISAGGGGGAQGGGTDANNNNTGGNGGQGIAIDFDGTYRLIGGGGGGGGTTTGGNTTAGNNGGRYGGGIGAGATIPTAGTAFTGGGGGGSRAGATFLGANGGSGLVIVRYTI